MWKAAFAGAIAFAAMGSVFAVGEETLGRSGSRPQTEGQGQSLVDQRIAHIKAALRLTAEQERYWPAVEGAIRAVLRRSEAYETAGSSGFIQRVGAQANAAAREAIALKRVVTASQPLIRSLDPQQRREAMSLAHAMGLGRFAAAF